MTEEQARGGAASTAKARDTALLTELTGVLMEPPMSFNSCTLIRVDENNPSVLQFLVMAGNSGAGSPYDGGCFKFDLFCPTTYPAGPPKCWLMTTGSGTVRFNPNLYDSGYVCLTVLNAKGSGGQTWRKNESNILEIILAIEYFCLNAMYPLFNEPSEESNFRGMDTDATTKKRARNAHWSGSQFGQTGYQPVREGTIKYAMIEMLRNPPNGFEDAVREHFLLKGKYIVCQIQGWIKDSERFDDAQAHRTTLKQLLSEFVMELSRLNGRVQMEEVVEEVEEVEEEEEEERKGESKSGGEHSVTSPSPVKVIARGLSKKKTKTAEEMKKEEAAMECTVMISNFEGSEKEVREQFATCGVIDSVKFPSMMMIEIKFQTKTAAMSCVHMNGTTVKKNKLNVKKKIDMKLFLFQDGKEIGPVPEATEREEYEYHQYPF